MGIVSGAFFRRVVNKITAGQTTTASKAAYGNSVGRDLPAAIKRLKLNPSILERSISALGKLVFKSR